MGSVMRQLLIRAIALIVGSCAVAYALARAFVVNSSDAPVLVGIFLFIAACASFAAWRWMIAPVASQVRNEEAERHEDSGHRFNEIFQNMSEGVVVYETDSVALFNRAALKTLQLTEKQLKGEEPRPNTWRLFAENGSPLAEADRPSQQSFRSGIPINGVIGLQKADGRLTWLRVQANPVFARRTERDRREGTPPKVNSVVVTFRDITDEREAFQRFELATKAVKLGVWDMDMVTGRLTWDEVMYQIYGVKAAPLKNDYMSFENYVVPEDRDRVRRTFELAMLECRDSSAEFRIQRPDGEIRVIRAESKGFYSRDGRALRHVGVNWDVTDQREQELRALQASKMSSLGEMSAGIAHEINNPLAIIIGKAEGIRGLVQSPDMNTEQVIRNIDVIEKTANRIAKIVRSLRAFSRDGQKDPFETSSVSEIVNEALTLCHSRFLNHGVELTFSEISEDLLFDVRSVEISQVLLNLLNNAFDAVASLDEKWVRVDVKDRDREIEISVTDSGSGIPADVREKMAQPFFTTKEVGAGTGLGLSIATGIVQSHSGTITVDTLSPNTRIVVRLPKNQRIVSGGFSAA